MRMSVAGDSWMSPILYFPQENANKSLSLRKKHPYPLLKYASRSGNTARLTFWFSCATVSLDGIAARTAALFRVAPLSTAMPFLYPN